jgi:predicted aldo/keto reductase-like oxidoreductase
MEQVRENLGVASRKTPMTMKQQEHMDARLGRIQRRAKEFCTACGYCMPCEHGVDIHANFGLYNQARLFGRTAWARQEYAALRKRPDGDRSAGVCKQCGACEPKCPQNVPIISQLRKVTDTLG